MALASRCLLGVINYARPQISALATASVVTQTPVLSAGSWQAAAPLSNLVLGKFYKPSRSTDATNASTKFEIDFGEARWIGLVALVRHNLTPVVGSSRIRVSVSTVSNFATTANTPAWVNAYQASRTAASTPASWALSSTAAPTQDELQHYRSLVASSILDVNYFGRYLRVEIDDTTNSAGYVELGGIFVGPFYQPTIGVGTGAALGWQTVETVSGQDLGGRLYTTRPRYRTATFTLPLLGTDEAMEFAFELEGRLGIGQETFFCADPTTANHLHRWSFVGNLETLNGIEWPYESSQYVSKPYRILEKI